MSLPGYCVSVETDTGGSGVMSDQRHGVIAYIHGHQSQSDNGSPEVASPAPVVAETGVVVVRSFTGGLARSVSRVDRTTLDLT